MANTENNLNNVKRIIFFIEAQFTTRDYNRFGVDFLIKNGYEVLIWDFTSFIHSKLINEYTPSDLLSYYNLSIISSEKTALNKINLLDKFDLVICYGFPNTFIKRNIFKHLSNKNITYGINRQNALPHTTIKSSIFFSKVLKLLFNNTDLLNYLYSKFQPFFVKIKPPNFIMASGEKTVNINNKFTKTIWTHKLDYDLYLDFIKNKNDEIPAEPYLLLLDEYIPFHPDGINEKWPKIDPIKYYSLITNFLSEIELKEKCPVIIAAHPRSQYESHPDYFQGRRVMKNKTIELVKNAKLVITHASTSSNFAVFFNKPIIFIKMNLISAFYDHWIETMASNLGSAILSVDEIINESEYNNAKIINIESYKSYKNNYIKKENSPDKNTWEIFVDYLNK